MCVMQRPDRFDSTQRKGAIMSDFNSVTETSASTLADTGKVILGWRAAVVMGTIGIVAMSRLLAASDNGPTSATLTPETGRIVVDLHSLPPPAPVFFSVSVDQAVRLGRTEIAGEMRIRLHV